MLIEESRVFGGDGEEICDYEKMRQKKIMKKKQELMQEMGEGREYQRSLSSEPMINNENANQNARGDEENEDKIVQNIVFNQGGIFNESESIIDEATLMR